MTLGNTLSKSITGQGKTNRVIATKTDVQPLVTVSIAELDLVNLPKLRTTRYLYDSFILGHSINGLLGMGQILDEFESGNSSNWTSSGLTVSDDSGTVRVGSGSMQLDAASVTVLSNIVFMLNEDGNNTDEEALLSLTDTNVSYSSGKLSQAADFNGTTSKQEQTGASFSEIDVGGAWSVSFWASKDGSNVQGCFLEVNDGTYWFAIEHDGAALKVDYDTSSYGAAGTFASSAFSVNNQFYHVVLTYTSLGPDFGTPEMKCYIDGTLITTGYPGALTGFTTSKVLIGTNDLSSSDFLSGSVDQMIWFDKTLDSSEVSTLYNSGSGQVVFSSTPGYDLTSTQSFGDISTETGAASGTPSQGTIGLWVYSPNTTLMTSVTLQIGSSSSDYVEMSGKEYTSVESYSDWASLSFALNEGWNYYMFDLDGGSVTGTPDWTSVDYAKISLGGYDSSTFYVDYFTVSASNYIGLNGLGDRRSSASVQAIAVPNNTWKTYFSSLENQFFYDSTNSTATKTDNSGISFTTGQVAQSKSLALPSANIASATFIIDTTQVTNPGNLTFYLSADGGSNWEQVTLNTGHTFTNQGTDLKCRVVASGTASISIRDSNNIKRGWGIVFS